MSTGLKIALGVLAAIILFVVVVGATVAGTYNTLVQLDQGVQSQWAQVQNVYQRRADLVPNLVATVKGAANFEQQTLTAVTEARSKVGQVTSSALENVARDPQAFQRFEQAQAGLSSALSRLMVVAERYPELKATQNFRDLQAQLEGTENRITVARNRYIDSVRQYNTTVRSFPENLTAKWLELTPKPNFSVAYEAQISAPPTVDFGGGSATPPGPAAAPSANAPAPAQTPAR